MKLIPMRVVSSDPVTGIIYVRGLDSSTGAVKARELSKIPINPDGSGGFEISNPVEGSRCLVGRADNNEYFIFGYYQTPNAVTLGNRGNSFSSNTGGGAGSYRIESASGSYFELGINGLLSIFAGPWASIIFDRVIRAVYSEIRSLFLRVGGGSLQWETSDQDDSQFIFEVGKQFDKYSDAQVERGITIPRNEDSPIYVDKFIIKSDPTKKHVVSFETRQSDNNSDSPNTFTSVKYGLNDNKEHKVEEINSSDNRTFKRIDLSQNQLKNEKYTNDNIFVEQSINNDGQVELNINDKANIVITPDGNIHIKSIDNKVYIGADTDTQQVVLGEFINAYLNHTHMGNMGVTTSLPMWGTQFPMLQIDPSVETPSSSNWKASRTEAD